MTKYRIRLRNGRVIGPFIKTQLFELKSKGHIQGNEEAQIFPAGDWQPIQKLEFFDELMDPNKTMVESAPKEDTFIIDISKLRNQRNQKEIDKHDVTSHKPMELTETVRMSSSSAAKASSSEPKIELEIEMDQTSPFEAPPIETTDRHDKTLINPVAQQEIKAMQKIAQEKALIVKAEEERLLVEEEERKEKAEAAKLIALDESTQMIHLDNLGGDLMVIANEEEQKIELEAREIKRKRKREQREEEEEEDTSEEDEKKKKKKKILLLVGGLLLFYALLFPDDEKNKKPIFSHIPPQISFPVPFDRADSKAAAIELAKGKKEFARGDYTGTVAAGLHYKLSFENDIENHEALNMLVRAYAEQLRFSVVKLKDATTLFNIIQGKRPFLMKNPNGIIGMNLFYMAIGKHEAAADVVSKYLKFNKKDLTQELFAVYLKSLMKIGKIDLAKQFSVPLLNAPDKNRYTYEALIEYSLMNAENDKALNYTKEAVSKFPKLVPFYLLYADQLLKANDLKAANQMLEKAEALNFENNQFYLGKYLELKGLLFAAKGDAKSATVLFAKALKIADSPELRMRLADLNTTNGAQGEADKLIAESKAYKNLNLARNFYEKNRFELAMSSAVRATDAFPGHIPSELFLAKVQLKLGLARQALKTLEELLKKYPDDKSINYGLIDAYIETYKFNEAKNRIAIISGSDLKATWEFSSVNAKLYIAMGDSLQAISWLRNSINSNPLNDEDIFKMAKLIIKSNSKFEMARVLLHKCMELDPVNPDYHIANANLLNAQQDVQAAVGYLLGLHEEIERTIVKDADGNDRIVEKKLPGRFHDNPKIVGEIAILYFQAGKVNDYLAFKDKLEKLPSRDKSLYEHLIRIALYEEEFDKIPGFVEELLKIEPGDIEAMMTAGKVLFENGKFTDASRWFMRVKEKMDTYPKVQYYIARIKFIAKDYVGAKADVEMDLKANGDNDVDLALLGQIYVAENKIVEAENTFKKAQKINPKNYEALMGMAELSTNRNNFDMALDLYKRAMKEKADEPIIHMKIGDVYRRLNQGSLAVESYKLYLEMNPEAPEKPQIESYINLMQ